MGDLHGALPLLYYLYRHFSALHLLVQARPASKMAKAKAAAVAPASKKEKKAVEKAVKAETKKKVTIACFEVVGVYVDE